MSKEKAYKGGRLEQNWEKKLHPLQQGETKPNRLPWEKLSDSNPYSCVELTSLTFGI